MKARTITRRDHSVVALASSSRSRALSVPLARNARFVYSHVHRVRVCAPRFGAREKIAACLCSDVYNHFSVFISLWKRLRLTVVAKLLIVGLHLLNSSHAAENDPLLRSPERVSVSQQECHELLKDLWRLCEDSWENMTLDSIHKLVARAG